MITDTAMAVLEKRYLQKDKNGKVVETPDQMLMRVATHIAAAEEAYGYNSDAAKDLFYGMMSRLEFLPNSPTLMNAGTDSGQLAACFVLPVEDSITGIFDAIKNAALIHKSGGGTGFSFSRIRPKNSIVGSTGGVASGPVSFMKIFNVATEQIKQGSRRRGANMAVLRVDHPDIMEFISCKQASAELNNFNISVGVTDDFMAKARKGRPYFLMDPKDNRVVGTLNATEVFDAIVSQAWHNGDPGIVFLDHINRDNPTPLLGEIESTNPCFTGDQEILTDQGPMSFKELEGKTVSVLTENYVGKLIYRPMAVFKTGSDQELLRVTLDDGTTIDCTPNHEFFDIDRSRVEAHDLVPGQRLASVYRHNANSKGYKRLTNGIDNPLEHHIPFEIIPEHFEVHHKNEIKDDNRPQNLELIFGSTHRSYHMKGDSNPSVTHPKNNWLIHQDWSGKNNGRYRHDITDDDIQELRKQGMSHKAIADAVGCSKYTVSKRLGYAVLTIRSFL